MSIRVMVIGATGFVGSRLVPALRSAGFPVTSVSRRSHDRTDECVDITDPAETARLFHTSALPDAIVHLAAVAHRPRRAEPSESYDRVNHRGTVNVLRAAERAGVGRFVMFSSAVVYGEAGRNRPVRESATRRPVGPYARSKAAAEDVCLRAIERGIQCSILRFPAIYAPDWLFNVRRRAYVPFTGNRIFLSVPGRQPRYSFCAVEHATDAVIRALRGRLPSGVYNVADRGAYTQREVSALVARVDGSRPHLAVPRVAVKGLVGVTAAALPSRWADRMRDDYWKLFEGMTLDTAKLRATGFADRVRLQDVSRARPARDPMRTRTASRER